MKLEELPEYEYPKVALCPSAWLDAEKAFSLGLSLDGLLYSMGYINLIAFNNFYFDNVQQAKDDFLNFYSFHNFTSLLDYFNAISVDLSTVYSSSEFNNVSNAVQLSHNGSTFLGKFISAYHICHVYALNPATVNWFTYNFLTAKLTDKTLGISGGRMGWIISMNEIWNLQLLSTAGIYLEPFTINGIYISTKRVVALKSNSICTESSDSEDAMFSCLARCYNNFYETEFNCKSLHFQTSKSALLNKNQNAINFCNFYDKVPNGKNQTFREFWTSGESYKLSENIIKNCQPDCPRRCDRIFYESRLHMTIKLTDFELGNISRMNSSYIVIYFNMNAVFEGGMWVLREVSTFSFIQMVNNVGGALGLFIGGTIMTAAQLILFFANYMLEKKRKKNIAPLAKAYPVQ